ncbi:MAG: hypothetical protein IMZ55_11175 [Acidobacteria bacterium]|nr:hypothetical protein [Planctomycetota bacterium]MBE3134027.1 hypothetical protein [Acidobacteriota bacterium]
MSQIGSSSGVRVAAQPLSNVYTVLLLIGGLALALTLVVLCITMNARYGTILGVSEEGKQAKAAPDAAKSRQNAEKARLQEVEEQLKRFPEGVTGTAPAVGGAPAEAAPAEAAPAEAAPAEAAPAEAAPAEATPAEDTPAEAAPADK